MRFLLLLPLLLATPGFAAETNTESEIEYLIEAIGNSGCEFIRNGKRHSARDAEEHIRMKYKRGRRYAPTTELFIERLASRSSMSKKPYLMQCGDEAPVESGVWLGARLAEYREGARD